MEKIIISKLENEFIFWKKKKKKKIFYNVEADPKLW
jgi:hypothetical protein